MKEKQSVEEKRSSILKYNLEEGTEKLINTIKENVEKLTEILLLRSMVDLLLEKVA
jgi:hypothetical protein